MRYAAIDLHARSSILCVAREGGGYDEREFPTTRPFLQVLFEKVPPTRVLIESSTSSEWVASTIESLGHEVIVADPNFALM